MGTISIGLTFGYSAILLPQLKKMEELAEENREIRIESIDDESWIASSSTLPMAPGCWLASILMERYGRRTSFLIAFPIFIAGWILIALSNSIGLLIIGRACCGLCVGLLGPLGPVYITETAEPKFRGTLLAGVSLATATGVLLCHLIGTWIHWRSTAYVCCAFPTVCGILCLLARESPVWLLKKGKVEEATDSWTYLRSDRTFQEFESLKNTESTDAQGNKNGSTEITSEWRTILLNWSILKPLGILGIFFFTCQFSGLNAVTFYSVQMFHQVSGENGYLGTIILDVVRVLFSGLACSLTRRYRRRTLMLISGFGVAFTLLSLSICLSMNIGKPWLPMLHLLVYMALVVTGMVPLPWILCGELFPNKYRAFCSGIASSFTFLCFFTVVKTGPFIFQVLQPYGTFAFYGLVALIGTILLDVFLPETKDKTLHEIDNLFTSNLRETRES
ncbi:facilitated trehalose transporter Tret1-like [Prorops nasuta]|uniref:facilitated trehalose transporter Tret1-like n=1 Tax=Prorops nasuta TaxID=863751 RepID=UPI0034CE5F05